MPMLSTPGPTISTSVPGLPDFLHCAEITRNRPLRTGFSRATALPARAAALLKARRIASSARARSGGYARLAQAPRARNAAAACRSMQRLGAHRRLRCACHSSSNHSPAQARARTIASASGRRAEFLFDRGLAGMQPIRSEADTRLPCANATHARMRRDGAAQRPETLTNVPRRPQSERTGRIRAASHCFRDLHSPAPHRLHARRHGRVLPRPTRSDPLGA